MPGGRLTGQDRHTIAAGLAARRPYAEIARELDRPTSTISREVLRNGGPDGYRADRAQRESESRARRTKPAPAPRKPAADDPYGRDPRAVRAFEEQFTTMMVLTGLPRMMARVFVCLVTSDTDGRTAAELVDRLHVSAASVSKAIGYLERLDLVSREQDSRRRDRYVIDADVWYRACQREVQICAQWESESREGAAVLGTNTPAGFRLAEMSEFFHLVGRDMAAAADHWRAHFATRREQR